MNTYLEDVTQTIEATTSNAPDSEVVTIAETEEKPTEKVVLEELKISGDALVTKVKELK